jgi:hypothetical protein
MRSEKKGEKKNRKNENRTGNARDDTRETSGMNGLWSFMDMARIGPSLLECLPFALSSIVVMLSYLCYVMLLLCYYPNMCMACY